MSKPHVTLSSFFIGSFLFCASGVARDGSVHVLPQSDIPSEQELGAMPRSEAMAFLLSTYKPQMDNIVAAVKHHAPGQFKAKLMGAKIEYTLEETPFAFYYDPIASRSINICLGGVNALDISAVALSADFVLLDTPGWYLNYLLYSRALRRHSNEVWLDPLVAAGINRRNTPDSKSKEMAYFAYLTFEDMLAFVVAHETAHFALGHTAEQLDGEDEASHLSRVREQEIEADNFALETVAKMEVNPLGVILALLTHQIVFEGPPSMNHSKHPADYRRITNAVTYFKSLGTVDPSKLALSQALANLFSSENVYSALDDLASSVSKDDLLVWPKRIQSSGSDMPNNPIQPTR